MLPTLLNLRANPRPRRFIDSCLAPRPSHIYLSCLFVEAECILHVLHDLGWSSLLQGSPSRQANKTSVRSFHEAFAQQQEKRYQEVVQKFPETATGGDLTGCEVGTVKHVWWSILHCFKFGILWRASEDFQETNTSLFPHALLHRHKKLLHRTGSRHPEALTSAHSSTLSIMLYNRRRLSSIWKVGWAFFLFFLFSPHLGYSRKKV